jgi:DNA-binding transcriptional regulator YdaS (Cro superfamily)
VPEIAVCYHSEVDMIFTEVYSQNNLILDKLLDIVGTQASLARLAGVTPAAVTHWRTGRSFISAEAAIRLENKGIMTVREIRPDLFK